MKLLLDQNLSHRLLPFLITKFADSTHVRLVGMATTSDTDIWNFARQNHFVVVTRDVDFIDRFVLSGPPPSVVWLNCGNTSTASIAAILLRHADRILALEGDEGCLTLD